MGKFKIALCDGDAFYRRRFTEYVVKHKAQEMELSVYSDREQFAGTNGKEEFDLILAGSGFESVFGECRTAVLFLADEYAECVAETPMWGADASAVERRRTVCKYQPMERVMHEVYTLLGKEMGGEMRRNAVRRLRIVGVCSPCGHDMQMMFSVLYAADMAREKKVLYLNFQEFSGFSGLFGTEGGHDVGDVVIRLRDNSLTPEYFWQCVYGMSEFSVLLPFENPENIRQMGEKEMAALLKFVEAQTDFGLVVIDFGVGLDNLLQCMGMCETVYKLCREGFYYRCRDSVLTEWLEKSGETELLGKIQDIFLPYHAKNIRSGGNIVEQLQWSEFGDFVRRVARGENSGEGSEDDEGYR